MRFSTPLFLLTLTAASIGAAPATTTTTTTTSPAPTTQQLKIEERAKLEADGLTVPRVGPFKLKDVVRLELKDKRIVATTPLPPAEGARRVLIEGENSFATILLQPFGKRNGVGGANDAAGSHSLQFLRYNFADPSKVFVHTGI